MEARHQDDAEKAIERAQHEEAGEQRVAPGPLGLLALQPERIAGSVPLLMVGQRDQAAELSGQRGEERLVGHGQEERLVVDLRPVRNLESMLGHEFRMRVIKVNKRRGNIVLSRKAVLEVENAAPFVTGGVTIETAIERTA